jgi:hypothetical protein
MNTPSAELVARQDGTSTAEQEQWVWHHDGEAVASVNTRVSQSLGRQPAQGRSRAAAESNATLGKLCTWGVGERGDACLRAQKPLMHCCFSRIQKSTRTRARANTEQRRAARKNRAGFVHGERPPVSGAKAAGTPVCFGFYVEWSVSQYQP